MATVTHSSDFGGSRYKYDTDLCPASKGWAQVDTRQDASYYGTWVNPLTFEMMNYCEGDVAHTKCTDEADFIKALQECIDWNSERECWLGIDPGWPERDMTIQISEALIRMGFGKALH